MSSPLNATLGSVSLTASVLSCQFRFTGIPDNVWHNQEYANTVSSPTCTHRHMILILPPFSSLEDAEILWSPLVLVGQAFHHEISSHSAGGNGCTIFRYFLNLEPMFQGRCVKLDWYIDQLPFCFSQQISPVTQWAALAQKAYMHLDI